MTQLSTGDLAVVAAQDPYVLALGTTGNVLDRSRADLLALVPSAEDLGLVEPIREAPFGITHGTAALDFLAAGELGRVALAFASAVDTGFGTCVAADVLGRRWFLRFWNRLAQDRSIVLLGCAATETQAQLRAIPPQAPPLRCQIHADRVGAVTKIDDAARIMLGWDDSVIGRQRCDFKHPDDVEASITQYAELLDVPGGAIRARERFLSAGGAYRWYDLRLVNELASSGWIEIEMIDVHEHVQHHPPRSVPRSVADALAQGVDGGVMVLDSSQFVVAYNDQFADTAGVSINASTRRLTLSGGERAAAILNGVRQHFDAPPGEVNREYQDDGSVIEFMHIQGDDGDETGHVMVRVGGVMASSRALPKGLSAPTLDRISAVLAGLAPGESLGSRELAEAAGLSEVTARRYLHYLVDKEMVEVLHHFGRRGRPRKSFRLAVE